MINIKVNSIGIDDIDVKVENDILGGQAIVEAINVIMAATEILYNVYDKKFPISFRWLEEELIE